MSVFVKTFLQTIGQEDLYTTNLTTKSNLEVRCQNCGQERKSQISALLKSFKVYQRVWCRSCASTAAAERTTKKRKQTMVERYGTDNPMKCDQLRKKAQATNLKKYGHTNPLANENIKANIKRTNLERYGVENPGQRDSQRKLLSDRLKLKSPPVDALLSRSNFNSIEEFEDALIQFLEENKHIAPCSTYVANEFNCSVDTISQVLKRRDRQDLLKRGISTYEHLLYNVIQKNYSSEIIQNDRSLIKPYELDIYLPELKIAIEFNGIYWHSEGKGKGRNYHKDKYLACKEKGVALYTIWEHEWGPSWETFIRKLITPKKRIYARKTRLIKDKTLLQAFIEENHVQGQASAKEIIGLEYEGSIVAALSIAPHHRGQDVMVLNRVCFSDYQVVGGLEKMLKALIYQGDLITWSDNCYAPNPSLYKNAGFVLETTLNPDYFYASKKGVYKSKQSSAKRQIGCPAELKEHEFMKSLGFFRVWDCGKLKWRLKRKT